jgi:pimeloyl-ACP methyl ester carboxylesterase
VSALTLVGAPARSWRDVLRRGVAERSRRNVDLVHPIVRALDRSSEDIIERAERREAEMALRLRGEVVRIGLAGIEQAIHTPTLALATMLHRSVSVVHGEQDAWSHPDEAALLISALRASGNDPGVWPISGSGHDLAEADDALIDEIAADLASRIRSVDLPPVLVAIEEMDGDVR